MSFEKNRNTFDSSECIFCFKKKTLPSFPWNCSKIHCDPFKQKQKQKKKTNIKKMEKTAWNFNMVAAISSVCWKNVPGLSMLNQFFFHTLIAISSSSSLIMLLFCWRWIRALLRNNFIYFSFFFVVAFNSSIRLLVSFGKITQYFYFFFLFFVRYFTYRYIYVSN